MGCPAATLAPSTLHHFWDLFGQLAEDPVAIYLDSEAYPIVRWGVERAVCRGVPVHTFRHHDVNALRARLKREARKARRPIVVTDGFCTHCGAGAPLGAYLDAVQEFGGMLVLDDTQALGVLGKAPTNSFPYGRRGGGSLRWQAVADPSIISIASLAKGFGVPVAVLAASKATVRGLEARSGTRVYSSPPAIPILLAAEHALDVNHTLGDSLRFRLERRVSRFREGLANAGLAAIGGLFPVQSLARIPGLDVTALHTRLRQLGVHTLLQGDNAGERITFAITARHSAEDIDSAVRTVVRLVCGRKHGALRMSMD
jgi:8-amino-7-oxononanoate synthase